jgi:hypothetical protein
MSEILRCPACSALVVDRRFPNCTTCHAALPAEWVLTPEQIEKIEMIDQHARAEHGAAMEALEPNPDEIITEEPDSTDVA